MQIVPLVRSLTAAALCLSTVALPAETHTEDSAALFRTTTPIKHLIVIFGENISFDHYFGTYPTAQNLHGETKFTAAKNTPSANNLATPLDVDRFFTPLRNSKLLTENPNSANGSGSSYNGANASNPFRLAPSQASTADQDHSANPEQIAFDAGLMDKFPGSTGTAGPPPDAVGNEPTNTKGLVMGYYDGNTVTAMWRYAQEFAINDNTYTTQFGPSTPGAINLISGQTNGIDTAHSTGIIGTDGTVPAPGTAVPDGNGGWTLVGDADPYGDKCSSTTSNASFLGKNVGDLLNERNITWGWFQGGFDLDAVNPDGTSGCNRDSTTTANAPAYAKDYVQHHQPFQYYPSTANLTHARPSSTSAIGYTYEPGTRKKDPANHQYDTLDFFSALSAGNLPAVSFLKAPAYQDAHPGNSDPLDEQNFIVSVVNAVENSPEWASTAILITYDDSDGWYDHQASPIHNSSFSSYVDALNGTGVCDNGNAQQGYPVAKRTKLNGVSGKPAYGRCGLGTRIPLVIISPWARKNYVDHNVADQSSVTKFIEDNWLNGQRVQPGGSADTIAGSIEGAFDFNPFNAFGAAQRKVILDCETGAELPAGSKPKDCTNGGSNLPSQIR